jgi:cyclic pyranopterin phosphate synthase
MVDVGTKQVTQRIAVASAVVDVGAATLRLIARDRMSKGDVLAVSRIAGISAAKRTSELIPLCHPLALESVEVDIVPVPPTSLRVTATARITGKTGVEMEALTAAAVAALTIYDMCKSVTKDIRIGPIQLESKIGGKSGAYRRRT